MPPIYDEEEAGSSSAQAAAQAAAAWTAYGAQSAASGFSQTRNTPAQQTGVDKGFGMWAQDFTAQLDQLELDLLRIRMVYDRTEKKWVPKPYGKPMLNELGVASIMLFLRPLISKNTYFANYSADMVHMKTRAASRAINVMLARNQEDFGLTKPADSRPIIVICDHLIESAYRQAMDNGARNWFQKFVYEAFSRTETPQTSNPGIIGAVKNKLRF